MTLPPRMKICIIARRPVIFGTNQIVSRNPRESCRVSPANTKEDSISEKRRIPIHPRSRVFPHRSLWDFPRDLLLTSFRFLGVTPGDFYSSSGGGSALRRVSARHFNPSLVVECQRSRVMRNRNASLLALHLPSLPRKIDERAVETRPAKRFETADVFACIGLCRQCNFTMFPRNR